MIQGNKMTLTQQKENDMKIEIKHRFTGLVLFAHDAKENSLAITLAMAVKACVDLRYANLRYADLSRADLRDADLRDANLRYADLSRADLRDADLRDADLRGANLSRANLIGANLIGVELRDADLLSADLTVIRDDIWAVLSSAPLEVRGLILALENGLVDGSTYTSECACLVGTLAHVKKVAYNKIKSLTPYSSRPAERFFTGIKQGDTPETSQFSALAVEWCEEWLGRMTSAFGRNAK
jgi:hypothetical protein